MVPQPSPPSSLPSIWDCGGRGPSCRNKQLGDFKRENGVGGGEKSPKQKTRIENVSVPTSVPQ